METDKPNFETKPIEPPILSSDVRDQLTQNVESKEQTIVLDRQTSGGFYKTNKFYIWAIAIGVVTIAVLSYFAFRKGPAAAPKEANVEISIDVPKNIPSGSEAVYKIAINNKDASTLVDMQLELVYPNGFSYIDSVPKASNSSGTLFPVPSLVTGQSASLIIKVLATGGINEDKQLQALLHYKYSNFNSEFAKKVQNDIKIIASNVFLELSGPQTANNAQLVIYNVKYKNNSKEDIANARIVLTYPEGFKFGDSDPKPDLNQNVWNINSLPKDGEGNIQIQGNFSTINPGESKTAVASLEVLGKNGEFVLQNTSNFITSISSLPLMISQEIGSENNIVKPGGQLEFKIKYKNNSSNAVSGVNIMVILDEKTLDLSALRSQNGQINSNTILWNAAMDSNLSQLQPNAEGEESFSVKVKDPASRDSTKNLTVTSKIQIKSNEYETYFPGNDLVLKISSPSKISGDLSFVSGSLPPQVSKSTIYKVKLSVSNSSNDYTGASLIAFIPAQNFDVSSITPAESSKTEFDSASGKLTWNIGSLPANVGRFSQPRILEFKVTIVPSASQKYESPALVRDIQLNAKDTFTLQDISTPAENITTSSLTGENNYGKGSVIP
jgi:hypothetical protein